ncbi:MAG TPA: acyl carrier protein [Flavobacteriales bacterium]|nr:acyl carrier protein [Flavobacteriales bacterium]
MISKTNLIKKILKKYAFKKSLIDRATVNSNMVKDLNINSARIVDIILDVEDEFEIEINSKDLEKIKTIKDLEDIIKDLISLK